PEIYCYRRSERMHFMGHPMFAMLESPQEFFRHYLEYRRRLLAFLPRGDLSERERERAFDLIHACKFATEMNPSTMNFFTDKVRDNPHVSIHDAPIDHAVRPPAADFSKGWEEEIAGGKTYRLFPAFVHPQPAEEIHLPGAARGRVEAIRG